MSRLHAARLQANRVATPIIETLSKYPGETLVSIAALAGWILVTAGIASLLPARGAHALWLSSIGLLLVSLCGWKFLRRIVTDGLYILTRKSNA
jgi:hypothetical protein